MNSKTKLKKEKILLLAEAGRKRKILHKESGL